MQDAVARPSGGAETVAPGEALRRIGDVYRGLFTPRKLALDAIGKMLRKKLGFHALACETVCIILESRDLDEKDAPLAQHGGLSHHATWRPINNSASKELG